MKDRKLAGRYARALLSVLPDERAAESADRFLDAVRVTFGESPEFRDLLLNPAVPRGLRKTALRTIAERADMPLQVANFLSIVVDHNRTSALPSIAEVFHEERQGRTGVVPAEITTARPLSDELWERTVQALERMTGKKVLLGARTEPGILGGAVTRIGSTVYDGSLRTQLAQLRRSMTRD
jgi:F-type H+-transporting ATPase subunit delta